MKVLVIGRPLRDVTPRQRRLTSRPSSPSFASDGPHRTTCVVSSSKNDILSVHNQVLALRRLRGVKW
jgi:hypothetical protein